MPESAADAEFAAALVLARRRRIGPFRAGDPPDAAGRRRELAIFARAAFRNRSPPARSDTEPSEAEALVNQLRR